jgi:hypothetical protein
VSCESPGMPQGHYNQLVGLTRNLHRAWIIGMRRSERRTVLATDGTAVLLGAKERRPAVKEGRKVWLITGSSRGFGAELVSAVLESGDAVLATARHPEDIKKPSDEHRERFRTAPLDVTDPGAAEAAVARAQADLGGLDVVVNNAGYANSASIEEMDPEDFRAQIEANLFGS